MMMVFRVMLLVFLSAPVLAANYYVVPGGSGTVGGTNWANAYSNASQAVTVAIGAADAAPMIYLAKGTYTNMSSTVGGYYSVDFTFSGGWNTNTLVVDGYSVFNAGGGADAFYLNKSMGSHNTLWKMTASSLIFTNCVNGISFWQTVGNMDNCQNTLRLSDCKGYATGTNVWLLYNHYFPSFGGTVVATNCTFQNSVVGIFNDTPRTDWSLDNVTVSSSGWCLKSGTRAGYFGWPSMVLSRCTLSGATVGLNYYNQQAYNNADGVLTMSRCVVSNCGIAASAIWHGGNSWSAPPFNNQFLNVYLTNNLFANNGSGIDITAYAEGYGNTGGYTIYSVNNTFVNNTNFSVQASSAITTGNRNPTMQTWNSIYDGSAVAFNMVATNSPFTLNEHHNSFFGNIVNMVVKGVVITPDLTDKLTDPLLTSTYGLLDRSSPCYNTGTSTNAPTTDLSGLLRPRGLLYDMGAYELNVFRPAMPGGRIVFSGGKMVLSSY